MRMEVSFPGGMAVESRFKGHSVRTDQPREVGGGDTGPAPFDVFLSSIATCAGFYALRFCQQRQLATDGLKVFLEPHRSRETGRLEAIRMEIQLPQGFPEKYRDAIVRSADQCAVKRAILDPPEIQVVTA